MADVAIRGTLGGRSLFGDLLGFDPFRAASGYGFEMSRAENGYKIEFPVPGFKPDQIDVTIEDRVLTITGKNERRSFTRTLVIPEEIDAENIAANVEHGLLGLELRIHPKAQPRKIVVTSTPEETPARVTSSAN